MVLYRFGVSVVRNVYSRTHTVKGGKSLWVAKTCGHATEVDIAVDT